MKFSEAHKGKRAERRVDIPLPSHGKTTHLASVAVALSGDEEIEALAFALKHAQDKGVKPEHAREGNSVYDLGYAAKVVALALRDPDAGEPGARPPTFTGDAAEVLRALQRETILYLFRLVEEHCDEVSPSRRRLTDAEMIQAIRSLADAEGDDGLRFFDECGPSLRLHLLRFMARQLVALLEPKSGSGGSTGTEPSTPTPSSL